MKKLVALLLVTTMLLGMSSFVKAEKLNVIFYDTFEGYPTNTQETKLTVTGGEYSVFEDAEKNKTLHISAENGK